MKCNSQHDVNIPCTTYNISMDKYFFSDERGQTKVVTEHETKLCL